MYDASSSASALASSCWYTDMDKDNDRRGGQGQTGVGGCGEKNIH
jgi:hypothetical protein